MILIVQHASTGLLIILPVMGFIGYFIFTTCYLISEDELIVKFGFLVYSRIKIARIRKIAETYSILGAHASSFDRLAIHYDKLGYVQISPKDKEIFIRHLKEINPGIEINRRKRN